MRNLWILSFSLLINHNTWAEAQPDIASIDEETEFKFEYHDGAAGKNQRSVAGSKQVGKTPIQPIEPQAPEVEKVERDVAGMEEQHHEAPKKELRYWDYEKEND